MVKDKLSLIFTNDFMNRLQERKTEDGEIQIRIDVHGMHRKQTKQSLYNMINAAQTSFLLIVVHGYNRGTVIKEMLAYDFNNKHVSERYTDSHNYGITYMKIVA